jgi:hypothetical protein
MADADVTEERDDPIPAHCTNNDQAHSWILGATVPQPPFLLVVWACPCGSFKTSAVKLNIQGIGPGLVIPTSMPGGLTPIK